MPPKPQPVTLRIELLDVAPLVWRRVLVSNQWTLANLHNYLQWTHAHEFRSARASWHRTGGFTKSASIRIPPTTATSAVSRWRRLPPSWASAGGLKTATTRGADGSIASSSSHLGRYGRQVVCFFQRVWRERTPALRTTSVGPTAMRCSWKS